MKKKKLFKKSLLIYTLVAFLLCFIFLIYIYFVLVKYENHQTGNFLRNSVASISDDTLKDFLNKNELDSSLLEYYKKIITSKDMIFKRGENDDTFVATLNDRTMFTIKTRVTAEHTRLGLFTYQEREVEEIIPELSRGFIYYDVIVPSNFKIYVDDKEFEGTPTKEEKYKDLDEMYYNEAMPKLATYEINNLNGEKKIKVEDAFGKEIELKKDKYTYTTDVRSVDVDTIEQAKEYIADLPDVEEIAHNWSLYLTRDLTGGYYGFNNIISKYVIQGTDMYKMAYNWSHNVDILFTSKHTLGKPPFENEKFNNFKIYGKDAFVFEVYLEKIMFVGGKKQKDIMHDYMYFIKNKGEWKLINIKSAGDKNE